MTLVSEVIEGEGKHPKHRIMKYREWFAGKVQKEWTLLDIGSNNGHMANFLSNFSSHVYGIEISQDMVDLANQINQKDNIKYICADATTFDYKNIKIDCVTMSNVLEHIENRVEFLKKLITQINWTSTPLFLIRVPLIDRDWMPVYLNELNLDSRLDQTHYTEYTLESFQHELKNSGLIMESHHIQWGEIYAVCKK